MNIIIGPFVFHESFVKTYKGLDVIKMRRKLKNYYTRSQQDMIIHYFKHGTTTTKATSGEHSSDEQGTSD